MSPPDAPFQHVFLCPFGCDEKKRRAVLNCPIKASTLRTPSTRRTRDSVTSCFPAIVDTNLNSTSNSHHFLQSTPLKITPFSPSIVDPVILVQNQSRSQNSNTMATSSSHVRKRQYQPSNQTHLGSYFNRDTVPSLQRSDSLSPALPADTAASLLSVGMRVRKSVPEGYKTHKTVGSPGFPFPSTAPPTSSAPVRTAYSPMQTRELTPFCGLHKIGGLAEQEMPSSAPAIMRTDEEDDYDMPALSTSQGSFMSTQHSFAGQPPAYTESKKRSYEDEAEEDMDAFFDQQEDDDMAMAQQSASARPIARLKGTTQKVPQQHGVRIFGSDDFEEAPFLMPMDMEQ